MSTTARSRGRVASATPTATAPIQFSRVADSARALVCEISACTAEPLGVLGQIAHACARDVGQSLAIKTRHGDAFAAAPVITLHLPAEFAASQHPAWCLACRLACFCPHARVSVLVSAAAAFSAEPVRRRRPRQAA